MDILKTGFSILLVAFLVHGSSHSGEENLHHKCIHDRIAERHPPTSMTHLGRADGVPDKRQTGGYLPYRMAVYYVTENITNSPTVIPMLNDPSGGFQLAINYLQSVLSVIRASRNLTIPPFCATERLSDGQCTSVEPRMCGEFARVPDEHLGTITVCDPTCREVGGSNIGVDADYILYVTAVNDVDCEGGTLAYASYCFFDDVNYRSLAGFTNICPQGLQYGTHAFFMLMLHEMLHAIGFSSGDFASFIDENGNQYSALTTLRINGANVLAINSSKVLSYAREYYSCPDLQGVLLENEGGGGSASSHWEARTISYELMIAASTEFESYYSSISNFTLLLLEDSGWYKVNYAVAESLYNYELLWGKGLGCNFISADCDSWPYSCSPPFVDGCSYDYQAASYCDTFTFYDGCYFLSPYSNGFCNSPEVPITNSCFPLTYSDGTLDDRCYNHQCYIYPDAERPFYTVTRMGSTQLCPYDGSTLTFSDDTVLTCPPAELTCSRNTPIITLSSTGDIPPSLCHDTCATCSRALSSAHCLTCAASLTLRGTAPSVCTTDNCGGGEFLNSLGSCAACAAGCRACTGPNIVDCLACEDETLYRLTTNQASTNACVTAAECDDTAISTSGDRICNNLREASTSRVTSTPIVTSTPRATSTRPIVTSTPGVAPTPRGGGASSICYHQFLLFLLLVVHSLYL